jgi:Protein of unknown function (DUF2853)
MSAFDDAIATYQGAMADLGIDCDLTLLTAVTKGLGPSIYNADSSKVSSSDPEEMARVKNNFLIKKLGLADGENLDAAVAAVAEQMGSSNRNKYRAVFYYLLVKNLGQEGFYA